MTDEEVVKDGDKLCHKDNEAWENCCSTVGKKVSALNEVYRYKNFTFITRLAEKEIPFPVGSTVKVTCRSFSAVGTVFAITDNQAGPARLIHFPYPLVLSIAAFHLNFSTEFLSLYNPIMIGGHEVQATDKGVKVGCTEVTDEQILQVAKLRNLKVD